MTRLVVEHLFVGAISAIYAAFSWWILRGERDRAQLQEDDEGEES